MFLEYPEKNIIVHAWQKADKPNFKLMLEFVNTVFDPDVTVYDIALANYDHAIIISEPELTREEIIEVLIDFNYDKAKWINHEKH